MCVRICVCMFVCWGCVGMYVYVCVCVFVRTQMHVFAICVFELLMSKYMC